MRTAYRTAPDTLEAIRADLDAMLGRIALAEAEPDGSLEPDATEALCRMGRELFTRRALEAAAEHAAALLPLLGRPRLVGPDFVPIDPAAAFDALDTAVVALDALDGDPEAEPWLGWSGAAFNRSDRGNAFDQEDDSEEDEDGGEAEPWLASPEQHGSQLRWAAGGHLDVEVQDHV